MAVNIGALEGTISLRDLFTGKLDKAADGLETFAQKSERIGRKLSSTGQSLTLALTAPIAAAGVTLAKLAADAVESESLFEVSFAGMSGAARQWSEDTSKALKLNQFELRRSVGVIYTMTEAMGLNQQAAFDMSTGVVELAGDLESFFNLRAGEGFQKLQSGLVGETEPLRALGVVIDEATIKAKAYEVGIAAAGAELTAAQKVQARWATILAQTSKAQGDLARTLESPANRLRALRTELVQTLTLLAMNLLPIFERVLSALEGMAKMIGKLAEWFGNLPPPVQQVTAAVLALVAALGPVLFIAGQIAIALSALGVTMAGVATASSATIAVLLGPVGWVAAGTALLLAWEPSRELILDIGGRVISTLVSAVKGLLSTLADWWESTERVRAVLLELGKIVGVKLVRELSAVVQVVKDAAKWIKDFSAGVVILVEDSEALAKVNGKVDKAFRVLDDSAARLLDTIKKMEYIKTATHFWTQFFNNINGKLDFAERFGGAVKVTEDAIAAAKAELVDWHARLDAAGVPTKKAADDIKELGGAFVDLKAQVSDMEEQVSLMTRYALSAEQAAIAVSILHDAESGGATIEMILDQLRAMELFEQQVEAVTERFAELRAEIGQLGAWKAVEAIALPVLTVETPSLTMSDAGQEEIWAAILDGVKEVDEAQKKLNKTAEENLQLAYRQAEIWTDVGDVLADVFDDLENGLGDLIYDLGKAAVAWEKYAAAKQYGTDADIAAARQQLANSVGSAVGNYLGGALAGGGQSGFGGEQAGSYSDEGAELGSYFGGIWGAVGAVLGGLISKSGDEARVAIEQFGSTIQAAVVFAEGGLGDAANELAAGFSAFMSDIQAQFGLAIQNTGGIQFDFTDRGLLQVSGAEIGTAAFETMGEAAAYAAEQILGLNAGTNNLGDNMTALLQSLGGEATFDSLEELGTALQLAAEADGQAMNGESSAIAAVTRAREAEMEIATKTGIAYSAVIAVADRRLAQIREEVEATRDSIFGVSNNLSALQAASASMLSYNAGIEAETNARMAAITSSEGYAVALAAAAGDAEAAIASLRSGSAAGAGPVGGESAGVTDSMSGLTDSLVALNNAAIDAAESAYHASLEQSGLAGWMAESAAAAEAEAAARAVAAQAGEESASGVAAVIDNVLGFIDALRTGLDGLASGTDGITQAMIDAGGAAGTMEGFLNQGADAMGSWIQATGMADIYSDQKEAMHQQRRDIREQINDTERAREATDALVDSLGDIPQAFSMDEIAAIWEKGAADAGLALLSMIRQVRGEEWGAAQERLLMASVFKLQLAVQLQSVYQLLAATELLSEATRAVLTGLAAEAERILGDNSINIRVGGRPRGGGGDNGEAQRRQEFRDQFALDVADTAELLNGWGAALVDMRQGLRDITAGAQEAREMGVSEALIAQYRAQQLDILRNTMEEGLRNTISGGGDSAGGIFDRYQEAATAAWELAGDRAAEFGTEVWQEMAPIAELIRQAFGVELTDFVSDQVNGLVSAGDLDGIVALQGELERMSHGVRRVGDMIVGTLGGDALTMSAAEYAAAIEATQEGIRQLGRSLVDSFETPLLDAQASADDFAERLEMLREIFALTGEGAEALGEIADHANQSLLGSIAGLYDQLGATEEAEAIKQQLARATFELQLNQMRILYESQLALGIVSESTQAAMESFFEYVAGVNLDDIFAPGAGSGPSYGGGGGTPYDPQQYTDSIDGLFNAITDTIDGWLRVGQGPLLSQALQMNSDLERARQQMTDLLEMENSPRTRALRDQMEGAFAEMSQAWADEVLASLTDAGTGLQSEFDDLIEHFADISAAFAELGILAENAEVLAAAQAAALQNFWDNATSGIQGIIDRLTGVESGRAPVDLLAEQQAVVQDLFERAMGGDLSALEQLDAQSEDFLDLIGEVFGSGRAGGILRDQLLAMLQQVAGIDPSAILGADGAPIGGGDGGGVFDPPGDGGRGDILGGLIEEPYVLRGSDLIAQPFNLAGYLEGGPSFEFRQALKENRREMEKAERDRERERIRRDQIRMEVDTSQRGALIRATRGIGVRPINESIRYGA